MKAIFGDKYKRLGLLTGIFVIITLYYYVIQTNDSPTITETVQQNEIMVTNEPYLDKSKLDNFELSQQPIEDGSEEDGGQFDIRKLKTTELDESTTSSYLKQGGILNLNPRHICNCTHRVDHIIQNDKSENLESLVVESSCSDEATMLGKYQKVVSYSLYEDPKHRKEFDTKYFFGAAGNVEGVKKYYPGWVMRIYSNIDLEPHNEMCALVCSDTIIYYCDARRLPRIGNLSQIHPTTWRFMPMGDETVEKFVVRDLDSRISQRERDAVSEWEASQYAFHGMRDHKAHFAPMMAGMWGGNNFEMGFNTARKLQQEFINIRNKKSDQQLLTTIVYRPYNKQLLNHDSYNCKTSKDILKHPFPTRRENICAFVGQRIMQNFTAYPVVKKCPKSCRPPSHQDWEYC